MQNIYKEVKISINTVQYIMIIRSTCLFVFWTEESGGLSDKSRSLFTEGLALDLKPWIMHSQRPGLYLSEEKRKNQEVNLNAVWKLWWKISNILLEGVFLLLPLAVCISWPGQHWCVQVWRGMTTRWSSRRNRKSSLPTVGSAPPHGWSLSSSFAENNKT